MAVAPTPSRIRSDHKATERTINRQIIFFADGANGNQHDEGLVKRRIRANESFSSFARVLGIRGL
jgi:hypothetical protein